jgi:hypothetical protein
VLTVDAESDLRAFAEARGLSVERLDAGAAAILSAIGTKRDASTCPTLARLGDPLVSR